MGKSDRTTKLPDWLRRVLELCEARPKRVIGGAVVIALGLAAFAPWVVVDTDPENMLRPDEPVRVRHRELKERFDQHYLVVVGVVNDSPEGIASPSSLAKVHALTRAAEKLGEGEGAAVLAHDILSLASVDDITPLTGNRVRFDWLMRDPPDTPEAAEHVAARALRNPMLAGTVLSKDRKAAAIYIPVVSKADSYRVAEALRARASELGGPEKYYVAGIPVAEDTFGVEMFVQMAISAPAAMVIVFLMMLVFFRRIKVIAAPMVLAMLSVLITMGALIATGNALHIMSSMIPIFIMPIAVLDSIHVVSELHERHQPGADRRALITRVMSRLYRPMLFTSLTSAAGFASLALTPIPPVQVFGVFVAIGIMVAWLLTMTVLPAWYFMLSDATLARFGSATEESESSWLARSLSALGRISERRWPHILVLSAGLLVVSAVGLGRIVINDNPVKWFAEGHELRTADDVMNAHFGGTYMAYLALEPAAEGAGLEARIRRVAAAVPDPAVRQQFGSQVDAALRTPATALATLMELTENQEDAAGDAEADAWGDLGAELASLAEPEKTFINAALLEYVRGYQRAAESAGLVGKTTSIADIAAVIHRELRGGQGELSVPPTAGGVAQALLAFESSHRPNLLWHFVTSDFESASVWLQLRRGDNRDMEALEAFTASYLDANPPPTALRTTWFGLTYINAIWQRKMVGGMSRAILGSSLVIFLLMTILLRSAGWGVLSLIPFAVSILTIYGAIGLVGKAYDMPVAVLSCLTLGLAVDFAIHFTVRAQSIYRTAGSWPKTRALVFAEPARAIARNALVVAIGFTPLLIAPLTPYRTVGMLLATILIVSAIASLSLLTALITPLQRWLFRDRSDLTVAAVVVVGVTTGVVAAVSIPGLASVSTTTRIGLSVGIGAACAILALFARPLSKDTE